MHSVYHAASENDIRCHLTKRKVSGGTRGRTGFATLGRLLERPGAAAGRGGARSSRRRDVPQQRIRDAIEQEEAAKAALDELAEKSTELAKREQRLAELARILDDREQNVAKRELAVTDRSNDLDYRNESLDARIAMLKEALT